MKLDIVCLDPKYMPEYQNDSDACMDLKVRIPEGSTYIPTMKVSQIFGTGIKVKVPEDYVMLIFPRSSTGMKLHCMISNTTGVIDSGYRDEIRIQLYNFESGAVHLTDGQRIAQFMILPRPKIKLNLVEDDTEFRVGVSGFTTPSHRDGSVE